MPKKSDRHRMELEQLLRSEEKMIVEKLAELKGQRNCLAIERLEVESRLTASINKVLDNQETALKPTEVVPAPSTSEAPSTSSGASKQSAPPGKHTVVTTMLQTNMPAAGIDDTMCNFEVLNLNTTPSLNTKKQIAAAEEYEEDSQQSEAVGDVVDMDCMDTSLYACCAPSGIF